VIHCKDISKRFGGVKALENVDVHFRAREIHGLVGENGAGKSTLMKILAGVHQPDQGELLLEGKPIVCRNPKHARDQGIRIVYQELSLVPDLTVAENLYLHRFSAGGLATVKRRDLAREAKKLLGEWGLDIAPDARVESLPMGKRQLVEIAREVAKEGKVLILDEPTSSLTNPEIEHLFEVLARLKSLQMAIVFISHRLNEVMRVSDSITVLRNGRKVASNPVKGMTPEEVVTLIVGRDIKELYPKAQAGIGERILSVRDLCAPGFRDISFDLHRGEILGLAGLVGSGRSEVMRCLFGVNPRASGTVEYLGKPIQIRNPGQAIVNGLVMLPESRGDEGIFPQLTVAKNLIMMSLDQVTSAGWLKRNAIRNKVSHLVQELSVVTYDAHAQEVSQLSGGNQQKVVLGRLMGAGPTILLLDEPTRGVDVGTKAEIHRIMGKFVSRGNAVIMVSSEIHELISACDRLVVLCEGRQVCSMDRPDFDEKEILQCAMGLSNPQLS
jgi:ABC-type sugar transport system ATPase subunit